MNYIVSVYSIVSSCHSFDNLSKIGMNTIQLSFFFVEVEISINTACVVSRRSQVESL